MYEKLWNPLEISLRGGVAREPEHKQKIPKALPLAQISRTITNCAVWDLGRSWLFKGELFSFYNCFKKKQWKLTSNFFKSSVMGCKTPKGPPLVTGLRANIK